MKTLDQLIKDNQISETHFVNYPEFYFFICININERQSELERIIFKTYEEAWFQIIQWERDAEEYNWIFDKNDYDIQLLKLV